jgi:hypothetical protein
MYRYSSIWGLALWQSLTAWGMKTSISPIGTHIFFRLFRQKWLDG